ncbi:MAG TPA: c-type cytochrome, partial [Candidatus Eisenbacteria bacterium]
MTTARPAAPALAALALAALAGCTLVNPGLPPAERGRRLAERTGCFGCHGAEGTHGTANPGRLDRAVPGFESDVMMYAKSTDEIREWIHDGSTAAKRASQTWRTERDRGNLRMPAFGARLSPRQIDDLVAFVVVMAGWPEPGDSLARRGLERAEKLGCVGCHGPGGRLARPNPGSLRGFVPPWNGPDFPELVRGRAEFDEWVERGVSKRFEGNPPAMWFLKRAVLKMPACERHLEAGDLDALWAYVTWLRGGGAARPAPPAADD